MIAFIDILLILGVVLFITQVFIPYITQGQLKYFWLFKRSKGTKERVEKVEQIQKEVKEEVSDLKTEVQEDLEDILKTKEKINNLK